MRSRQSTFFDRGSTTRWGDDGGRVVGRGGDSWSAESSEVGDGTTEDVSVGGSEMACDMVDAVS